MPVEIRYMLAGTASPVAVNDVALEPTALIAELKDLIKAAHPQALRRFDSTELELFLIPPDLARGFQRQFLDDQVSQEAVQVITNATPPMMAERSLHDVSTSSSLQIFVVVPNSIEDTKLIRGALPFFTELPLIKLHRGEWLLFLSQIPAKRRVLFLTSNPPVHFDGRTMWTYSGSILPDEYLSPYLICLMDFAGDCSGYKNTLLKKNNSLVICSRLPPKGEDVFSNTFSFPDVHHLPLWTAPDLKKVANILTSSRRSNWRSRFSCLGGIPRAVFADGDDPEGELVLACHNFSLRDFGPNGITPATHASQLFIHIACDPPF
ncbi:hypothetical protein Poli38472_009647 [Pythium oligandrum]|uniref:Uncharacterized protein n=1 Tax=Pythium oligandrum TaxID=41045 RepID=A0A8K1CEU6_PYTOL|nr:hypothetical protein Poli38472_009647 [Pythium oligandrum]|eukprot:TMW62154.1 hypothetical protein Poli38472_009647 [Pythium oligandrum]